MPRAASDTPGVTNCFRFVIVVDGGVCCLSSDAEVISDFVTAAMTWLLGGQCEMLFSKD
jgi:hypothetical protein